MKEYKICGVTTRSFTVEWFMLENLKYLTNNGYKAYVICEPTDTLKNVDDITFYPIDMKRGNVSVWEVLRSVWQMIKIFRKEKFDIIQYASSNAGLYAAIAGWITRVPVRIYCQWGISYTDYTGIKYWFYKAIEKVTCCLSTNVQPDSHGNLEFSVTEKLYKRSKGNVVFNGSACGVSLERFDISKRDEWRNEIHQQFSISVDKKVFGFVGRLALEKGVNELLEAFLELDSPDAVLLVVGPYYGVDELNQEIYNKALNSENIIFVGPVSDPSKFYAAFDFLILPSYREGFGMVVLESAAMGTPIIVSDIIGPTEFVKDNHNGLYCDVKSASSLRSTMLKALSLSESEYLKLCENAYSDVSTKFNSNDFKEAFLKDRNSLLSKK